MFVSYNLLSLFEVTPVKFCTGIVVWVMPPCSLVSMFEDRIAPF